MKILVTGAGGFVGKNLVSNLRNIAEGKNRTRPGLQINAIYTYDRENNPEELDAFCRDCDFVFNLAGVNRPKDNSEFMAGNFGFASTLLDTLKRHRPVGQLDIGVTAVLDRLLQAGVSIGKVEGLCDPNALEKG